MIVEISPAGRHCLRKYFQNYRYQRVFIEGTLDGQFGRAWADDPITPQVALLQHSLAYLGGNAVSPAARDLVQKVITVSESVFVPSAAWGQLLLAIHPDQLVPVRWTSFNSKAIGLDQIRHLKQQLPPGFRVKQIDRAIAHRLVEEGILVFRSYDRSPEKFVKEGIGFCVFEGARIAGVINSMAIYQGQLKGHITTLEPYRGRGIATAVAAYLVEYCLEHQIEYCWEATNKASMAVAKKLGFREEGQMTVYQAKAYLPPAELN